MSVLTGTLSGAIVASGVYYAFSNTIKLQTNAHRAKMHMLSNTLIAPSLASVHATLPAAARIAQRPVSSLFTESWNHQVEALYNTVYGWERALSDRGKKWLYGIDS